jgi:hypothetical protein
VALDVLALRRAGERGAQAIVDERWKIVENVLVSGGERLLHLGRAARFLRRAMLVEQLGERAFFLAAVLETLLMQSTVGVARRHPKRQKTKAPAPLRRVA